MPPLAVAPKTTASGAVPEVGLAEPETDRAEFRLGRKALAAGAMISKVKMERKITFDKLPTSSFDFVRLPLKARPLERRRCEDLCCINEDPFDFFAVSDREISSVENGTALPFVRRKLRWCRFTREDRCAVAFASLGGNLRNGTTVVTHCPLGMLSIGCAGQLYALYMGKPSKNCCDYLDVQKFTSNRGACKFMTE